MKSTLVMCALYLFLAAVSAPCQLVNGNFETWSGVTGTPPTGTASSWGGSALPVRGPGLVSGSTYSCILSNGLTFWQGILSNAPSSYQVSQVIAVNATGNWSPFSLTLQQVGAGGDFNARYDFIKLQLVQGTSGFFSLQARDGSTWRTIATNIVQASTYSSASNSFTTLNAYNFTVTYNSDYNTYSVSCGLVGSSSSTSISNLSYFNLPTVNQPLACLVYYGGGATQSCAIDNVSVAALTLSNGNFELWGTVTGTPPTGTASSWGGSALPVRGPGLVSGSTYSCILNTNTTFWQGIFSNAPSSYMVSQVLAVNATPNWCPFALTIQQVGAGGNYNARYDFIKLQLVQGSSGYFSLQARDSATWRTIATNIVQASTYSSASNSFTTLNAYNLIVAYNSDSNTYAVSYGLVGSPLVTISNLSYFAAPTINQPLACLVYYGGGAAQSCAIDNVSVSPLASVVVQPSQNPLDREFLGFGAQWDSYSYINHGINDTDLALIKSRLAFMKIPFVRMAILSRWCYTTSGYITSTPDMTTLCKNLTICQDLGIDVILTDWGCETTWLSVYNVTGTDDPLYASIINYYTNYLINTKHYSCIKYFIFTNEPNAFDTDTKWMTGLTNVYNAFSASGLISSSTTSLKICGPDQSGGTSFLSTTLANCSKFGAYDLHYYALVSSLSANGVGSFYANAWSIIRASDLDTSKPLIVGEAGYSYPGNPDAAAKNPYASDWPYGMYMPQYAIQSINAGSSAVSAWMLDDNSYDKFTWGMWGNKSDGFPIKPWFYTWSLLCRSFPKDSTFAAVTGPCPSIQIMAAKQPGASPAKYAFCIVNSGNTPVSFTLQWPGATAVPTSRYLYTSNLGPVDANGLPVPTETFSPPLGSGVPVTCSPQSVTIFNPQ